MCSEHTTDSGRLAQRVLQTLESHTPPATPTAPTVAAPTHACATAANSTSNSQQQPTSLPQPQCLKLCTLHQTPMAWLISQMFLSSIASKRDQGCPNQATPSLHFHTPRWSPPTTTSPFTGAQVSLDFSSFYNHPLHNV